ncbi:MAG: FAD-dependent oxidoreductase, partial [Propionibacteriaceae bacterium]
MARPRRAQPYRPGRDVHALRHPAATGLPTVDRSRSVVVVGGGIAGLAAATALAERGVEVTLVEREAQLGGRVRAWPVTADSDGGQAGAGGRTMSRGFHAFFRQYYNLRRLLRRADPALSRLIPIDDYPLQLADGPADSFARLPRTP